MKLCCIFWPVFGCCTLQTLTEICLFHVFVCFHKTVLYMLTSVWMPHTPNAGQSWLFNAGLAPLQTSKKADFEQCLESTLEIAAPKCWSKFTTKKGRELPWRKIVIVQITNILLLSKYRLTNLFITWMFPQKLERLLWFLEWQPCNSSLMVSCLIGSTQCSI